MGKVIHFEIPADNVNRAVDFYKNIFGWSIQKWSDQNYWLIEGGSKESPGINGAITNRQENLNVVVNTISVDSIEKTISEINNGGGTVLTPIMDIPKVGKFAYFKDTEGNTMGILQAEM